MGSGGETMDRGQSWHTHFLRALAAVLLCFLALRPLSVATKSVRAKAGDKHDDYEYQLISHSSQHQKNDRCPPPPQALPDRACEVPSCRSDSECERHKRCCYNGCIYACLESVQPPPAMRELGVSCQRSGHSRGKRSPTGLRYTTDIHCNPPTPGRLQPADPSPGKRGRDGNCL
ncbi:WAP four-disulfide core domain protein 1 [Rhinoraja longicauda]